MILSLPSMLKIQLRVYSWLLFVTAFCLIFPCGCGSLVTPVTSTPTVVSKEGFVLSSSVGNLTLLVGSNTSSTPLQIGVIGQNGFVGNVALSTNALPTGVTVTFSPASTSTSSILIFTASNSAIPGTYTVAVNGISGSLDSTTSLTLTIPQPNFTISSSVSKLSLLVNTNNAGNPIGIGIAAQNGFSGQVSFTLSGLPSGVTYAFSSISAASSSLILTLGTEALPGTYTVTITGTSGTLSSVTTFQLTIPVPSFSLTSSLNAVSLQAGGIGTSSTITIVGTNNFINSVMLSVSGLPAGITAAFNPASTTTSSNLSLIASSSTPSGSYTANISGTSGTLSGSISIALTVQTMTPLTITIPQPTYGFNVLPRSVRRVFATITGGGSTGINWSTTGGGTISSTTGDWVDVTAPANGSNCAILQSGGSSNSYSVDSATQFRITAQSQQNPNQTASIDVNVCNPSVQINIVPFYTTLYAGQKADVQAFVWGSTNRDVTWKITSQPSGGDGALSDASFQDTVFSATVPGRYTLTATSLADATKTNTATLYVTGHPMPYQVTTALTMPIDCTVDPAMTGTTYEVGPSQAYKTISSIPWNTLAAGSTVRIHNEDKTGNNPTTYHAYFQLVTQATRTQPVRVCGVPDSGSNLPIIDASNAVGNSAMNPNAVGYAAVTIGTSAWAGVYTGTWNSSQYLIVEGLKVQNASSSFTYTTPAGVSGTAWVLGATCIRQFRGMDVVIRGNDLNSCDSGIFSDFNANNGFFAVANTLYEGNHTENNGVAGSYTYHQFYIQGWNEVVQFNIVDRYRSGAQGSNFKGRGFPEIVRYNHFGDGAARELDMVDNEDAGPYTTFEGYLSGGTNSYHAIYPADAYTADLLASAVEAHHADFVYGNTFLNTTATYPIHYSSDHGLLEADRIGTLWFYNNSFYAPSSTLWSWHLFDTSDGGGNSYPQIEWPQIQAMNNAIWMDSPAKPYFNWNVWTSQFTELGVNAINSNWGTDILTGGDGTGWATVSSTYAYQGASNSAGNTGMSNLLGVSTAPFDTTTFMPNAALINAGAALPPSIASLPVRFQYGPTAIQILRKQPLTLGSME